MVVALLSLGGIPPLLGFFPKIFIISSLVNHDMISLALVLVIGSTLNLYYYIKVGFNIFLDSYSSQPFLILHSLPPRIFVISSALSVSTFTGILALPLTII
jgi:NADH:ubiquinone oxidoreductase subunit 2 (subunit N)